MELETDLVEPGAYPCLELGTLCLGSWYLAVCSHPHPLSSPSVTPTGPTGPDLGSPQAHRQRHFSKACVLTSRRASPELSRPGTRWSCWCFSCPSVNQRAVCYIGVGGAETDQKSRLLRRNMFSPLVPGVPTAFRVYPGGCSLRLQGDDSVTSVLGSPLFMLC